MVSNTCPVSASFISQQGTAYQVLMRYSPNLTSSKLRTRVTAACSRSGVDASEMSSRRSRPFTGVDTPWGWRVSLQSRQ